MRGTFEGTLITHDRDSVVKGTLQITEATLRVTGTMRFTMSKKNGDQFKLEYKQSNGPSGTATMVRQ